MVYIRIYTCTSRVPTYKIKPVGAPFVCIEPWLGYADNEGEQKEFRLKDGLISLDESCKFRAAFTVEIN
jgi:galactose mutarotase-like enzyme